MIVNSSFQVLKSSQRYNQIEAQGNDSLLTLERTRRREGGGGGGSSWKPETLLYEILGKSFYLIEIAC